MSKNASQTASLLLLLQVGSRALTFAVNQVLLGLTTPSAFATATIHLEPLLNTVLFVAREGVRSALLRTKKPQDPISELSLIPFYAGVPLSVLAFSAYVYNASYGVAAQPYFYLAIGLYALSTLVELASEPMFNRAQVDGNVRLRVKIEGRAIVAKALATLATMWYGRDRLALLAFAIGQTTYALSLLLQYWMVPTTSVSVIRKDDDRADKEALRLSFALTQQSFVKQILTEGDKLLVSRISPIEDQGGYGLALNYGSLVARVLFQPLEESSRMQYTQALVHFSSSVEAKSDEKREKALVDSLAYLRNLVKLQLYMAMLFTCFAPPYIEPLMYHAFGKSRWMDTNAPDLLKQYLYLLPLLGMNGILEAFVQAVASEKQLARMSGLLLVWSGIYCMTCYLAVNVLNMRESALILANGVSMACRIVYSYFFIQKYSSNPSLALRPSSLLVQMKLPIVLCVAAIPLLRQSYTAYDWTSFKGVAQHLTVGASVGVLWLGIVSWTERQTNRAQTIRR